MNENPIKTSICHFYFYHVITLFNVIIRSVPLTYCAKVNCEFEMNSSTHLADALTQLRTARHRAVNTQRADAQTSC